MSATFSIVIDQTSSEALKLLKEERELARQKVCALLQQLNGLEDQRLDDTEEYAALMAQLENAEPYGGEPFYELTMAGVNFATLNTLLQLPTADGDAGRISAELLLLKIAHALQVVLSPGGKEWERSEEPPSQKGRIKIMATRGLSCADLEGYLQQLQRIASFAYANSADVSWS